MREKHRHFLPLDSAIPYVFFKQNDQKYIERFDNHHQNMGWTIWIFEKSIGKN
ncbi:hypothetical protein CFter6_0213 [Collimonas fungivorans]|uniref:Uncharacterized protein n=1 Tax=Collimonas fungivorans TaxID=158899 RepID=A0A127P5J1_9BURK|nr:hypothetical protein CFter6_0213 [Collimonas fungivorans]